jgi:GntR family transcriptional regulator of vanillate catabolism
MLVPTADSAEETQEQRRKIPMATTRQKAVVDSLREMILRGEIVGGQRLLEIPLSNQLGISRTPIREAMITLAEEGLLEYRPNRGYIVRTFDLSEIMDAYTVRETLEGLACRLAAEKGLTRALRKELETCLADGDRLLAAGRLSEEAMEPWGRMNDTFHRLIVGASGNMALCDAWTRVTNIPYSSSRVVHWFDETDVEGFHELKFVHAEHHAILRAILEGDGYRAETKMRGHIEHAAEHIRGKVATVQEPALSASNNVRRLKVAGEGV